MPKWSRKRKNKDGTISYTFRVYHGYTTDGERLKPYVQTWKSPANLTERQADKEAERQFLIYEEQCKTGLSGDATRITLSEFVPLYLEQKKPALSPTTYEYYCRAIQLKILPALGHHKIKDIKPVHVQAFVNQLCNIEKKNRNGSTSTETLSPATIRRNLTILQSIMKLAVGHGDIETTNKYLHCLSEADEEAAGVLQSMLIKQTKYTEQEQKQA